MYQASTYLLFVPWHIVKCRQTNDGVVISARCCISSFQYGTSRSQSRPVGSTKFVTIWPLQIIDSEFSSMNYGYALVGYCYPSVDSSGRQALGDVFPGLFTGRSLIIIYRYFIWATNNQGDSKLMAQRAAPRCASYLDTLMSDVGISIMSPNKISQLVSEKAFCGPRPFLQALNNAKYYS